MRNSQLSPSTEPQKATQTPSSNPWAPEGRCRWLLLDAPSGGECPPPGLRHGWGLSSRCAGLCSGGEVCAVLLRAAACSSPDSDAPLNSDSASLSPPDSCGSSRGGRARSAYRLRPASRLMTSQCRARPRAPDWRVRAAEPSPSRYPAPSTAASPGKQRRGLVRIVVQSSGRMAEVCEHRPLRLTLPPNNIPPVNH
ncbi:hypothetical protein NDU88_005283 [Pleurodeles waltl]|uniref:Uncharacterized protein n=1 Tax=Pleurodeles waltl TaxID=8319 RepID=A0AAV7RNN0_PLEWA|nr:hypothetical protein NDU88_005283 [Pleurodeles waltl]